MDISSMLEVQVNEVKQADSKENVTPAYGPSTTTGLSSITQEEYNFYKLMFGNDVPSVRFRKLHCTACDVHIGSAPSQAHNMLEHPVLRTLLCLKCREFYGDGKFEQGDDATDMFCRWCANGGNLYCCSYCSNTFCYKCIRRNFDSLVRKKIEADEKWKCFVCNPSDLFSARAICWALLQHVQTVRRILQNDQTMSPQEVEEKMNLDESQCCPRRRKRKRRRTGSSSDEEDDTYIPSDDPILIMQKRKPKRKSSAITQRRSFSNGTSTFNAPIPIRPSISLKSQIRPSTVASEQLGPKVKLERKIILATALNSDSSSKLDTSTIRTPLFNSAPINAIPTQTLLRKPASTSIELAINPVPQSKLHQAPSRTSSVPMVTIPNNNANFLNRSPAFIRGKGQTAQKAIAPNIIEIDSDSDDPTVTEPPEKTKQVNEGTSKEKRAPAVPVALLSSEEGHQKNEETEQPPRQIHPTKFEEKNFNDVVILYKQSINEIMNNLKSRLGKLGDSCGNDSSKESEMQEALHKTKVFHHEIRMAVKNLAAINDMVVRDYLSYQRTKTRENNVELLTPVSKISVRKDIKLPLDMVCVNESAGESDDDDDTDVNVISPSPLVLSTNIIEDMLFRERKQTVSRSVGDYSVLTEDKAVQAYNITIRDYEKRIGYSLLTKANSVDGQTENIALRQPVVSNTYFGKYEEQYIYYLQHIEDFGIQIEDADESEEECQMEIEEERGTEDTNGAVTEDRNNDSRKISDTVNTERSNTDVSKQRIPDKSPRTQLHAKNCLPIVRITEASTVSTPESVDGAAKTVSNLRDDLGANESGMHDSEVLQKTACGIKFETEKDMACSDINNDIVLSAESEEDCTIIDD